MSRPSNIDRLRMQLESQRLHLRSLQAIEGATCRTETGAQMQREVQDRIDALTAAIAALGGVA